MAEKHRICPPKSFLICLKPFADTSIKSSRHLPDTLEHTPDKIQQPSRLLPETSDMLLLNTFQTPQYLYAGGWVGFLMHNHTTQLASYELARTQDK